jgi:pimeloyl-ACP methyl ester carboxylesterase
MSFEWPTAPPNKKGPEMKEHSEARNIYEQRRQAAENYLINPENLKMVETESGPAKVRTVIARWDTPKDFKGAEAKPDTLRVTVYVPGMFECDKPNFGNYPLEIKLAGTMLMGDTESFVVLKAEGLNKESYVDADGQGRGQSLVAEEAVKQLEKSLQEMKQKMGLGEETKIEFEVVGSSEGSTQGASIAEKIVEKNLGKVNAFTSIGGVGLAGEENQTEAGVIDHLRAKADPQNEYPMPKTYSEVGEDTFLINREMIGDAKQGGYEYSLGKAYVDPKGDIRNVAKWGWRYLKSKLGLAEEVPHERVQAVFSKNHDFEKLAANGVPIVVLAGSEDAMFPAAEIQKGVEDLRSKGGKVLQVVTNMGHSFPHENPSGTAMALRLFRNKAGI